MLIFEKLHGASLFSMCLRRQFIRICALVGFVFAMPAFAATQIDAPESVRELLVSHLSLSEGEGETLDATARVSLERRLRKDASQLLATEGYFSPQIKLRDSKDGLEVGLVVQVEPGQQAHIGSISIEIRGALGNERRQQLISAWGLPAAAPFRQSAWDEAKNGLLRELMSVDHAAARLLSSEAEVDVATAQVNLQLIYDAGPRYRYGEIRILGLQRYQEALVSRYNTILKAGAPYRQADLLAVQMALQNTPYFSSVNVEMERGAGTDSALLADAPDSPVAEEIEAPVIVSLRERTPFNISLGAGYSSNTGARVEANFRSADFLGRAWELNTGARIEQLQQSAYADIFLPPDLQKQQRDSFGALVERSDIEGLGLERVAFAASREQKRGGLDERLGLSWQYERQTPDGIETSINRALTASVGWVWRHADDPLDAAEGIVQRVA